MSESDRAAAVRIMKSVEYKGLGRWAVGDTSFDREEIADLRHELADAFFETLSSLQGISAGLAMLTDTLTPNSNSDNLLTVIRHTTDAAISKALGETQ